jgi:hypothetical protein
MNSYQMVLHRPVETAAVFGHLRLIRDGAFWNALFSRAHSGHDAKLTLKSELDGEGVDLKSLNDLDGWFWPYYNGYGEPDLLLRFGGNSGGRSLLLIIEVKLYSGKSECGVNDQLKRYYDLLQDKGALGLLVADDPVTALVYLTERYAADELRESVKCSGQLLASKRMFSLQWQDVLEAGEELRPGQDTLLGEVVRFLKIRGFERFRGFPQKVDYSGASSGHFYANQYFQHGLSINVQPKGSFYGE